MTEEQELIIAEKFDNTSSEDVGLAIQFLSDHYLLKPQKIRDWLEQAAVDAERRRENGKKGGRPPKVEIPDITRLAATLFFGTFDEQGIETPAATKAQIIALAAATDSPSIPGQSRAC